MREWRSRIKHPNVFEEKLNERLKQYYGIDSLPKNLIRHLKIKLQNLRNIKYWDRAEGSTFRASLNDFLKEMHTLHEYDIRIPEKYRLFKYHDFHHDAIYFHDSDISEMTGIPMQNYVDEARKRLGLVDHSKLNWLPAEDKALLKKMIESGKPINEIVRRIKKSRTLLVSFLEQCNVRNLPKKERKVREIPKPFISKDITDEGNINSVLKSISLAKDIDKKDPFILFLFSSMHPHIDMKGIADAALDTQFFILKNDLDSPLSREKILEELIRKIRLLDEKNFYPVYNSFKKWLNEE